MIGIHTLFSCVKENYLFHSVCNLRLVHTGSSTHTHTPHTHAFMHVHPQSHISSQIQRVHSWKCTGYQS